MKEVVYVEHIISLPDALRIVKELNQKKHRGAGYFVELTDLNMNIWARQIEHMFPHLYKAKSDGVPRYGDYGGSTPGWHLKVTRTQP